MIIYYLFAIFPNFTGGIKAKLNWLESESDIFPQNEGKVGKYELTPVIKALTNCVLLWILYNQDIIDDLESECLLYADDTCLFAFGKDPVMTIEKLNRDLVKIGLWAEKWNILCQC